MLSRLITSTLRRSIFLPTRNLRISASLLGGGGHHDHHAPIPTNIPQPGPSERSWFGEGKTPRISEDDPYTPGAEDYGSYVGAAIGVLLTFLAVVNKGGHGHHDSGKGHDHHGKASADHAKHEEKTHAPVKKEEPAPAEDNEPTEEVHHEPAAPLEPSFEVTPVVESKAETTEPKVEEVSESSTPTEESSEKHDEKHEKHDENVQTQQDSAEDTPAVPSADKIPEYVEYLLVGAGTASYYAALAIRARDADAKVLMVGDEKHLPYNRPPLSKELWWYGDEKSGRNLKYKSITGKTRDVFFESQGFFVQPGDLPDTKHGGVSIVRGKRVTKICPTEKKAFLEDGTVIRYNKCLLATGGRPKQIKELESASPAIKEKIVYFRGVDDYRNLEKICSESKSVTIVGGGFLGSELAYGIKRKYPNMQIIKEKGNLARVLPEYLSEKATHSLRKQGVNIISSARISGVKQADEGVEVKIAGGEVEKVKSDYVLVATGIEADTSVAEASGLEVDQNIGGVLADAELRVCPDVYAAGDVCSFFDHSLGRRRVEHWEHAQITGRLAGENMTGGQKAFWFQSSYFTKISPEYHLNAVGNTDSSLETVSVFAKDETDDKYERGVIFYKDKEDKVVGLLMINVSGPSVDVGRRLIEDRRSVKDFRELSKLFPLFEQPKDDTQPTEEVSDKN